MPVSDAMAAPNSIVAPHSMNVLKGLWRNAGFDAAALNDIAFTGAEPVSTVVLCGRDGGAGDDRGFGARGG